MGLRKWWRRLAGAMVGLGLLLPAAPAAAASVPVVHGPAWRHDQDRSFNWGGYAATGGPFESVSASWTIPTGTCTDDIGFASFWIGLDGFDNDTVEQTGTDVVCHNGKPLYDVWYELFPAFPVYISRPVTAGDHITASVTAQPRGLFLISIANVTQGWTRAVLKPLKTATRTSAEVITERAFNGSGFFPYVQFDSTTFTNATVDGRPLGHYEPTRITMATDDTVFAEPSPLVHGQDFTLRWVHT
jgi:hypothetical protein